MAKVLKKEVRLFFFLVFLCFLLLFLDHQGWLGSLRKLVEKPVLALEGTVYGLKLSSCQWFKDFSYWQEGEKELMRLQGQVRQLAVDQAKLSSCQEENEAMRRLLGAPLSPQWQFLPAKVIGLSEKMRLDKGSDDGFREGMMVVSENILVGRVVSVTAETALVQLLTDLGTKIPVVIKKPGSAGLQARGLLLTQPGGDLLVDRILQEEDVRVGDLVLTAGEDWLPDLLIGQVEAVLTQEAALHKQAQIGKLVDYQALRIVFGIKP